MLEGPCRRLRAASSSPGAGAPVPGARRSTVLIRLTRARSASRTVRTVTRPRRHALQKQQRTSSTCRSCTIEMAPARSAATKPAARSSREAVWQARSPGKCLTVRNAQRLGSHNVVPERDAPVGCRSAGGRCGCGGAAPTMERSSPLRSAASSPCSTCTGASSGISETSGQVRGLTVQAEHALAAPTLSRYVSSSCMSRHDPRPFAREQVPTPGRRARRAHDPAVAPAATRRRG